MGCASALDFARTAYTATLAVRIEKLAMGRSNRIGHAQFAPGEIRRLLLLLDSSTGELREATPQGISGAIRSAKEQGLIRPGSSARCLQLPGLWQKAGLGDSSCHICHINVKRAPRGFNSFNDWVQE